MLEGSDTHTSSYFKQYLQHVNFKAVRVDKSVAADCARLLLFVLVLVITEHAVYSEKQSQLFFEDVGGVKSLYANKK